jgi:hypothetical protein
MVAKLATIFRMTNTNQHKRFEREKHTHSLSLSLSLSQDTRITKEDNIVERFTLNNNPVFIGLLTICQRIDTSSAIQMAPPPPAPKLSLQMGCVISRYD